MNDNPSTYANPPSEPPCTLETMKQIMDWFEDRMPAVPVSISVHPDYLDLFKANLRESGFVRSTQANPMCGLPVFVDGEIAPPWRVNYRDGK